MNQTWTATDTKSQRINSRRKPRSFLLRNDNKFDKFANRTLTSEGMKWAMVDPNSIVSPD